VHVWPARLHVRQDTNIYYQLQVSIYSVSPRATRGASLNASRSNVRRYDTWQQGAILGLSCSIGQCDPTDEAFWVAYGDSLLAALNTVPQRHGAFLTNCPAHCQTGTGSSALCLCWHVFAVCDLDPLQICFRWRLGATICEWNNLGHSRSDVVQHNAPNCSSWKCRLSHIRSLDFRVRYRSLRLRRLLNGTTYPQNRVFSTQARSNVSHRFT